MLFVLFRKMHNIFAAIHTVFCIVVMLGRSQSLQRCNAHSLVARPRCIKACILILLWCYINNGHWDTTMVLPCSSAAKSSYNDNDTIGNCATHIGKAVMLKFHVCVAYSRVVEWDYNQTLQSALTTAATTALCYKAINQLQLNNSLK